MNSIRTKVTRPRITKSSSKFIAHASSIASTSQALKNIFKSTYQAHKKGFESENRAAVELSRKGFQLLATRWKTPFAEIDLLFEKDGDEGAELFMVEVKSLGRLDFGPVRVSRAQRERLLRAREWLENKYNCATALAFAYVLADGEILLLNAEGEELS
jgi:putative endonuclease